MFPTTLLIMASSGQPGAHSAKNSQYSFRFIRTYAFLLHCNKYNASIPFSGRRLLIIGKEIQHKLSLNKATFIWELSSLDWFPRDTYLTHLVKLYQDLVQ